MALSSCQKTEVVNYAEHKKSADAALQIFHSLYNDQKFDEIYVSATPILQGEIKPNEFDGGMKELFSRFGRVIESVEVATACFPLEVRTVRHTKYERGEGGEMIIWSVENGQTRMTKFSFAPGRPASPTQPYRGCEGTSLIIVPGQ
ncbi:MAG: hypothetical protein K2Y28_08985 [Burkholderiaceae bacterium]|nr:hypothetical protein [Burkholderiaceae bacterium]